MRDNQEVSEREGGQNKSVRGHSNPGKVSNNFRASRLLLNHTSSLRLLVV